MQDKTHIRRELPPDALTLPQYNLLETCKEKRSKNLPPKYERLFVYWGIQYGYFSTVRLDLQIADAIYLYRLSALLFAGKRKGYEKLLRSCNIGQYAERLETCEALYAQWRQHLDDALLAFRQDMEYWECHALELAEQTAKRAQQDSSALPPLCDLRIADCDASELEKLFGEHFTITRKPPCPAMDMAEFMKCLRLRLRIE